MTNNFSIFLCYIFGHRFGVYCPEPKRPGQRFCSVYRKCVRCKYKHYNTDVDAGSEPERK